MNKYYIYYFVFSCLLLCGACESNNDSSEQQESVKDEYLYKIRVNDYTVIRDSVKKNETLAGILLNTGLSSQEVHSLIQQCDSVFDVRKLMIKNPYTAMYMDSSLVYFVYEINISDYLVFDLSDSAHSVYKRQKEVSFQERKASGVIETSLWNALVGNNLDPNLAIQMSDIYAWSIDFFSLQKGDNFKVVYVEKFVDTTSVGIENVKYAMFNHAGHVYYAIPFEQDGVKQWFDEKGNSTKKAFLKAPLKYSRISSHFSNGRRHPILKIVRPHHGVDYAAPAGTPVHTIGDGVVVKKGYSGGAGNMITIKHNATYTTTYMHLKNFASGVSAGKRVKQGQVIGYVGSSGLSTGPHLDFRVYKKGTPINPLTMISPPSNPVKKGDMPAFKHLSDSLVAVLNSIK